VPEIQEHHRLNFEPMFADVRIGNGGEATGDTMTEETMEHSEFRIGAEFYTEVGLWRCTDIGTRTIVAVRVKDGYPAPDQAPPFSDAVETVFDEYDFPGLYREPVKD
jgi:hypothetical protein